MSIREHARRRFPLGVVALLGAGLAAFAALRPTPVEVARVEIGPVVREALGTGTIEAEAQLNLAFTIAGRVDELRVEEGDVVRTGEVLAVLDPDELSRQRSIAERNVDLAAGAARRSEAEVARMRVELEAATIEARRVDELHATGSVATAERDAVHERLRRAEADLATATAARRHSEAGVVVARETARLHERRIDDTRLTSPVDGVVVRKLREPGDAVAPGSPVVLVVPTEKIWARVWMDESTLQDLSEGQEARVVLRGAPQRSFRARVDRVGMEADRTTHELLVDLELIERPARLVFGQRVDAFVTLGARPSALRVPQGACDVSAGRCFVARDDRVARADVRFGLSGNDWIEVVSGVAGGEDVILPSPERRPWTVGRRVRRRQP